MQKYFQADIPCYCSSLTFSRPQLTHLQVALESGHSCVLLKGEKPEYYIVCLAWNATLRWELCQFSGEDVFYFVLHWNVSPLWKKTLQSTTSSPRCKTSEQLCPFGSKIRLFIFTHQKWVYFYSTELAKTLLQGTLPFTEFPFTYTTWRSEVKMFLYHVASLYF